LVTEYIANGDLVNLIKVVGRLEGETLKCYIRMISKVVYFMHKQNCVHRDLKLDNILLSADFQIKLIDFSFGTLIDEDIKNKSILGTERYMSPQLI
jgi:serine/threonine protein kinase